MVGRALLTSAVLLLFGAAGRDADAGTERLDLRGGRTVGAETIRFSDGSFTSADWEASVPGSEVVDWWIAGGTSATGVPVPELDGDEAVRSRLAEAKIRGQELAEKFPGCRGVIVRDEGRFTLTDDHRHVYRYHFIGLMLSEETLDWARLQLSFTEGRSRQKLLAARCLTQQGRIASLKPADMKVGIPGRGAVHFDPNARRLSASIPGAEVGGVVEYIYEYEAYNMEDWRLFSPGFFFEMDVPCVRSRLEVNVPAGQDVYWWTENLALPKSRRVESPHLEYAETFSVSRGAVQSTSAPPICAICVSQWR